MDETLFPHEEKREVQDQFLQDAVKALNKGNNLLAHAPTGLGKTTILGPALFYGLRKKKTIFFLTPMHTQHRIAVETLKLIKKKHGLDILAVDFIGKRWMCQQPGIQAMGSSEFAEYCSDMLEKRTCEYYSNIRSKGKLKLEAQEVVKQLKALNPLNVEKVCKICGEAKLCPYEMSCVLAKNADVIICDYFHVLSHSVRDVFFKKMGKDLSKSVLVFDEAHNLPSKTRDLLTSTLSTFVLDAAVRECSKMGYEEFSKKVNKIRKVLEKFIQEKTSIEKEESLMLKKEFVEEVEKIDDYKNIMLNLNQIGNQALELKERSATKSAGLFLESWLGPDEGFARILKKGFSKKGKAYISLSYRCLDPSMILKPLAEQAQIVCMSGTLTPVQMYKDLFGFETETREYTDPFPKQNRLSIIVPKTTTKFTERDPEMWQKIAVVASTIVNAVPGNSAVFFPSYYIRDKVNEHFQSLCEKTTFTEHSQMSKEERDQMLENYKTYKEQGAVLLGVSSGSFSVDSDEQVIVKYDNMVHIEKIGPFIDKIIEDKNKLLDNLQVPVFDSGYKIKFRKVDKVIKHRTNEKLTELTLTTNRKVKTTSAHSVFSLEDGKIKPKQVAELKIGDYLVIPGFIPTEEVVMKIDLLKEFLKLPEKELKNIYLSRVSDLLVGSKKLKKLGYRNYKMCGSIPISYVKNKDVWKKDVLGFDSLLIGARCGKKLPRYFGINKEFARLLGYYVSEGHSRFGRHSDVTLSLGIHEKEVIRDAKKCMLSVLKMKPCEKVNSYHGSSVQYAFGGKVTRLIFNDIFKAGYNAHNKRVPWIIFQLPDAYKIEFLKGYFAGDGSASKAHEISCTTVSKDLASDLMYLFLQLEIFANLSEVVSKERYLEGRKLKESIGYHVYISNIDQINKVLEIIPQKHLKRVKQHIEQSFKNRKRRTLLPSVIPIKESGILRLYKEANPAKPRNSTNIFTRIKQKRIKRVLCQELLDYIISHARKKYDKELVKQIKKLINSDLAFARVKKIKHVKPTTEYVYDFSVKGYENFVGGLGGIFLHNSEGIDLPGDYLKSVMVIGLPLAKPDLETKQLIEYYDKRFGRGWDYGYVYPAMIKTIQNAGRCIRSKEDKGVIIFLDERYQWQNYYKCFPKDWQIKITRTPISLIKEFFKK